MENSKTEPCRCRWCNLKNPLYVEYHDREWGVLNPDEQYLFEMLILESFQAGLSWECVLNKREHFREVFCNFDLESVTNFDEGKLSKMLADPGLIRNRLKLRAAVTNARIFRELQKEFGSFGAYLKSFCGDRILYETGLTVNPVSDAISKDLRKRGMKFCGSTIIYAYLQAVGLINSHEPGCFLAHSGKERHSRVHP